jgi:small-conductance mechanosensitive channel
MSPGQILSLFALIPVTWTPNSIGPRDALRDTIPAQEDSTLDRVTPQQAEIDRRLGGQLSAMFQRIPGLDGIDVQVEAGVVVLSGAVLSGGERELADSLARQAAGVLYVDNRIAGETSVGMRLRPLLQMAETKLLTWLSYLPLLVLAAALVFLLFWFARGVYRWEAPFRRVSRNPFLQHLVRQVAAASVGVLGVLLALELLDATALVGAVLGAAGVAGIAVGFAFRNIAENYLAGIILSIRQPFSPDDHVLVEGQEGKVIRLTSRETLLMTLDGNHVRIPNATIFNSVVQNYTRNPLRRFRFDMSVGQNEDLTRVLEVGRSTLEAMEGVLNDPPPRAIVSEVGDSWVVVRFFGWVDQSRVAFDKARSEAVRLTKKALDTAGISMPAPEYGLRWLELGPGGKIDAEGARPYEGLLGTRMAEEDPDPEKVMEWERPLEIEKATEAERVAEAVPPPDVADLAPDQALDEQIARDRNETGDRDLLGSTE